MKLKGLIEYIDQVKPNAFTPEVKTVWVNEIEGMIQEQIMLLSPADIITYDYAEDAEAELLVPPPHTKLYYAYLQAMIDFAVGEYRNYANTMELFNRWWNEYAAWYALRIDPASGDAKFRGYYLSAYAIAVKHGYTGTEEEWAQVLIDAAENARRAEEAAGTATAASDTAQAAAASADTDSKAASDAAGEAQSAAGTATAAAGSAQDAAASATEAQDAALLSAHEAERSANRAEAALTRAPKIIDGIWFVWDATAGTYVSTGVTAEGGGSGLDPTAKTDDMDNPVGVDDNGELYVDAYSKAKVDDALGEYITEIDEIIGDGEAEGDPISAVLFVPQTLTDEQKEIARENIGASSVSHDVLIVGSSTEGSTKKFQITVDDAGTISAVEVSDSSAVAPVVLDMDTLGYTDGRALDHTTGERILVEGYTTTNVIDLSEYDAVARGTLTVSGVSIDASEGYEYCGICCYDESGTYLGGFQTVPGSSDAASTTKVVDNGDGSISVEFYGGNTFTTQYIRISAYGSGADAVISISLR